MFYLHTVSQGGGGLLVPRGQDINTEMFYFISKPLLFVAAWLSLFLDQSASCLCWNERFDALLPTKKPQRYHGCRHFDLEKGDGIYICAQEKRPLVIKNIHKQKE